MTRPGWIKVTMLLLALAAAAPAIAQQRLALLVGVSSYPKQPDGRDISLVGPKNDVRLMQRVLAERGFKPGDIVSLADGVTGAGDPTRAAIVSALEGIGKKAGKGDFVFLFFAGHGSQQPARNIGPANPEPDGLDETFLPRDVGRWDGGKGTVQNALVDDEFDTYITAIRNRGAFVWAVFDSCHSGTVTRSVVNDPEIRTRELKPADLGVPREAMAKAQSDAVKALPATRGGPQPEAGALGKAAKVGADAGGFVAFYAVQSSELEKEQRLPEGHPDRQAHGRLAFTLSRVLAMNRGMSYRQAGQQLLQLYAAANYLDTTPLIEGAGGSLDAPVFGDREAARVMQWRVVRDGGNLKVDAGAVHQLGEGAVFAVLPDAVASDDKALGFLSASKVEIYQSMVVPTEYKGKPKLDPAKIPEGSFARLLSANQSVDIRVALPPAATGKAKSVLDRLSKAQTPGMRVTWTQPKDGGDIRLFVREEKLWILPPGGELFVDGPNRTHSIDLQANSEQQVNDKLVEALRAIGKAINLTRLSAQTSSTPVGRSVDVGIYYTRGGKRERVTPEKVPRFRDGDLVEVEATNGHTRSVDISIFVIQSDFEIQQLYPERGRNVPIEPSKKPFPLERFQVSAKTTGQEAMLFIITETQSGSERPDFSFLAQKGVERTRGGATAGDDLAETMRSIGFEPEKTRGMAVSRATTDKTSMRLFRFITEAPASAKK